MLLTRLLTSVLSPGGARGGLSVLIFHRVLPNPDPLFPDEPDAARFAEILDWVGRAFNVLPLDRAIADLSSGSLPPRALAITFDDGYADNYTVALPILQQHGMSATFFIASDYLDGGRMWNDTVAESLRSAKGGHVDLSNLRLGIHPIGNVTERRKAIASLLPRIKYLPYAERLEVAIGIAEVCGGNLPDDLMMTSSQLRALRTAGMVIGGHTRTHPILARLDDDDAYSEIAGGKIKVEEILGEPISLFAYPNGKPGVDYACRHVEMVRRAGYASAVSTSMGVARTNSDLYQLPRFTPWDRTPIRFGVRLANNMRFSGRLASV